MEAITLDRKYLNNMTEDQFFYFCQEYQDWRIERNSNLDIIIIPPLGSLSGSLETENLRQLANWNKANKLGKVFSSSTGFTLPDKSVLSPDASWISLKKWDEIPIEDQKKFAHICPEFVIELKSESDKLESLQNKIRTWMSNGCQLAWLIDLETETVYIYRCDGSEDNIQGFNNKVSGENVLPGFEFDLSELK